MQGTHGLMAALLYGAGMRLMACIRLRVKDIDFAYNQIVVRDGKGQKDCVVPLPQRPVEALQQHLEQVKRLHTEDTHRGCRRGRRRSVRPRSSRQKVLSSC